jgi:hypothetical protein
VLGSVYYHAAAQIALGFRRLFAHQVACERPAALYFPGTSHLETLLGAGMGFHFRHDKNLCIEKWSAKIRRRIETAKLF